ncbi:MAG: hypothetical protein LR015_13115 [Verrucomicrobia bacterium]|nr:hypothetical protein [Verrucomicrobiota bacterium]
MFQGASFVNGQVLPASGGELAISGLLAMADGTFSFNLATVELLVGEALRLDAETVTIQYDPNGSSDQEIAVVGAAQLSSPMFNGLSAVTLTDLSLRADGFSLGTVQIGQAGGETVTVAEVVTLTGVAVQLENFAVKFANDAVEGVIDITVAELSQLEMKGSFFSLSVSGLTGTFDFNSQVARGELIITAATISLVVVEMMEITGSSVQFTPGRSQLVQSDSLSASIPTLEMGATVLGLRLGLDGSLSATGVTLDDAGSVDNFGLGGFLPFTVTSVSVDAAQAGSDDRFSLETFGLTVEGAFAFDKLAALPFTPVLQIGTSTYSGSEDSFSFSVVVVDGKLAPNDLGPIQIGFSDLAIGNTVILGGTLILGGYQNGVWMPDYGGTISLQTSESLSGFSGDVSATVNGSFDDTTGVFSASASLTVSFEFADGIAVKDAELGLNLAISVDQDFGFAVNTLEFKSASIGSIQFEIGTIISLEAVDVVLNFNPGDQGNIAEIGSLTVTFDALDALSGTAVNFGIDGNGRMVALADFSVTLSVAGSADLLWPEWLPIDITNFSLEWQDFANDRLDFAVKISATVSKINDLPLDVSGEIQDLEIDLGLLRQGMFPVVDIGTVAIQITGEAFGGQASGTLILGVVRFDAEGNRISGNQSSSVADRVLYGAIQADFEFAGLSGFQIRVGISQLGPLEVYLDADIPILLEPISGLSISNFRAGVVFDAVLPAITDPLGLRDGSFNTVGSMSLEDWINLLEQSVVTQHNNQSGGDFWAAFSANMRIEGGATLFSMYTSELVFRADVDILISTDGKFLINARGVFADNLSLGFRLYANLTEVKDGDVTILFLSDLPAEEPLMTIFGGLTLQFERVDGTAVSAQNQADSVLLKLTGGVTYSAAEFLQLTISGEVDVAFTPDLVKIDMNGTVDVTGLGDAIGFAGLLRIDTTGGASGIEVWGVLDLQPNFTVLQELGLHFTGSAYLELNATNSARTETLTVPGTGAKEFVLKANTFIVSVTGAVALLPKGGEQLAINGSFSLEISANGFDMEVSGTTEMAVAGVKIFGFSVKGGLSVTTAGTAGSLDLTITANPGFMHFSGTGQLQFNTRSSAFTAGGVSIPAGPDYLRIHIDGNLTIQGIDFSGKFVLEVTSSHIAFAIDAIFALKIGSTSVLEFEVDGNFFADQHGVAASLALSAPRHNGSSSFGFSVPGTGFELLINTRTSAIDLAGVKLPAGPFFQLSLKANLTIGAIDFDGTFVFTQKGTELSIHATAAFDLKAGSSTIISFTIDGELMVGSAGIQAVLEVKSPHGPTSTAGFGLSGTFQLAINTGSHAVTVSGISLPAHYFALIAKADLTASGFKLSGSFTFVEQGSLLSLSAAGTMSVFDVTLDFKGDMHISASGLYGSLDITTNLIHNSFVRISGDLSFVINTTRAAQAGIAANTYEIRIVQALVDIGGVRLSGSLVIRYSGKVFTIAIPASAPLTLSIGSFATVKVSGSISSNGQFSLTGSVALSIGNPHYGGISGSLFAKVSNSKVSASFSGSLNLFNQNVAPVSATVQIAATEFSFTANVAFNIPGGVAHASGTVNVVANSNYMRTTFTLTMRLFNTVNVNASGFIDSRGTYSFTGSTSVSVGNSNIGARFTLSATITNSSFSIHASGSAWAKFSILKIKVGPTISFSASVSSSGALDIWVGTCVKIFGKRHCAGVTVKLSLHNGISIWSSEVSGGMVYFDANGNGVHDDGEPFSMVDESGNVSFVSTIPDTDTGPRPLSLFEQLDIDGDGVLSANEVSMLVLGGTDVETGISNDQTLSIDDPLLAGHIRFANATVFIDRNGNGTPDGDDLVVVSDNDGFFSFTPLLFPVGEQDFAPGELPDLSEFVLDPVIVLGELAQFDLNGNGVLDADEGVLVAVGGTLRDEDTGDLVPVDFIHLENSLLAGFTPQDGAEMVFFDVNQNGQWDPGEPMVVPDEDGFYSFLDLESSSLRLSGELAMFDSSGNGLLEHGDGVFRFTGGIDPTTGLPLNNVLSTTADDFGNGLVRTINPLSDLVVRLMDAGLSKGDAILVTNVALGLPESIITTSSAPASFAALNPTHLDDLLGTALKVDTVALMIGALISGQYPDLDAFSVRQATMVSIADLIQTADTDLTTQQMSEVGDPETGAILVVDLESLENLETILRATADKLGLKLNEDLVSEFLLSLSEIVAEIKERMADNLSQPIAGFAFVKSLLQSTALPMIRSIASGEASASNLQQLRGDNLQMLLASVRLTVPLVSPLISTIHTVTVVAGSSTNVNVSASDPDGLDRLLEFTIASFNEDVISPNQSEIIGIGGSRSLNLRASFGFSGTVTLNLLVSDRQGMTSSVIFQVTVLPAVPFVSSWLSFSPMGLDGEQESDPLFEAINLQEPAHAGEFYGVKFIFLSNSGVLSAAASLRFATHPTQLMSPMAMQ